MTGPRLFDIEICHIYLERFLADRKLTEEDLYAIERGKRYARATEARGDRARFSVMLDDGDGEFRCENIDEVRQLIEEQGVVVSWITHESDLASAADPLIESIRGHYRLTQGESTYLSVTTGDRWLWARHEDPRPASARDVFFERLRGGPVDENERVLKYSKFWVPLRYPNEEGKNTYSCSLLTAVWYLSRLGVEGFPGPDGVDRADMLANVLPIDYLKNEAMALEIIRLSSATRIKKCAKKIEYIFI